MVMSPYLVMIVAIPIIVKICDVTGNRMMMLYMISVFNLVSYLILMILDDCDRCVVSAVPLILQGIGYSVLVTILFTSMPFVAHSSIIGTAMGVMNICINTGMAIIPVLYSYIHDNTIRQHGYFWATMYFVALSVLTLYLTRVFDLWDQQRGSIFKSRAPFEDFKKLEKLENEFKDYRRASISDDHFQIHND